MEQEIPFTGLKGLRKHWKNDIVAAISVALVALPLSLAIAVASGIPPIAGLITAVIGGVVTTFFRSGYLSINGPAAGLIGVIFAAVLALDDGCGPAQAYRYVLAAIIIAGFLQVIIGLLKLGRIADVFPTTVIQGILASIGIIIFAKQMHVAMGTHSDANNTIGIITDIFYKIPEMDPRIAIISGIGIILLLFHAKISYKVFHFIPAPVWVLAVSVPIVLLYNYMETNGIAIFGQPFVVPDNYLIDIPSDWMDGLVFPDFSKIHTGPFWMAVISINLLSTVITLAGAKAVDKLDPYKRKTNMNRDMVGVGISSMVSGAVGGLPIITVIVRSTVNVHNNAKTKWSNFYHGLFIALFILALTPIIQLFPKAALASVLVITGIKLASPRVFKEVNSQGLEQLIFLVGTIIITLYKDPLYGLIGGMSITLIAHLLISRVGVAHFFQMIFNPGTKLKTLSEKDYVLQVRGIANFLSMLKLIGLLEKVPQGANLKIDLSKTRLVDFTVQEKLADFKRIHKLSGGTVKIVGMEGHISSCDHSLALKNSNQFEEKKPTARQMRIRKVALDNNWLYTKFMDVESSELLSFDFFKIRPIESKFNVITGDCPVAKADWEISDIVFDEGAMLSKEVYKTTVQVLHLPFEIPTFKIEQEGLFDKLVERVRSMQGLKDINFDNYPVFSKSIRLISDEPEKMNDLFTPKLISFLESEEIYHIESNGNSLMVFKALKFANTGEIKNMIRFSNELVKLMCDDC